MPHHSTHIVSARTSAAGFVPGMRALFDALAFVLCAAVVAPQPAGAQELAKGMGVYSLLFTQGTADLITPADNGGVTAYDHSEWGGMFQVQKLLSDDWALAVSVGLGTFRENDVPDPAIAPGEPEFVYSQSSWNVRLGTDRFVHLGDRFHLYVGPGLQYWNGKAKFEHGDSVVESENTSRWALGARIGGFLGLGPSFGLTAQLGTYFAHASGSEAGAEAKWWPSGQEGAFGVGVTF